MLAKFQLLKIRMSAKFQPSNVSKVPALDFGQIQCSRLQCYLTQATFKYFMVFLELLEKKGKGKVKTERGLHTFIDFNQVSQQLL